MWSVLVVYGLVIYALVCVMVAASIVIQNMEVLVEKVSPLVRYEIFLVGLIFVVLVSPIWLPIAVGRAIRILWLGTINTCRLLDEDRQ